MDIVSRQRINLLIQLAGISSVNSNSPAAKIVKRVAKECEFPDKDLNKLLKSPEPIGTFGALSPNQKEKYVNNLGELMGSIKLSNHKALLCQKLVYDLVYSAKEFNSIVSKVQRIKEKPVSSSKEELILRITA